MGLQEAERKICLVYFGSVCESGGENFQLTTQPLEKLGVNVVLKKYANGGYVFIEGSGAQVGVHCPKTVGLPQP